MSSANRHFYLAVKEAYEPDWMGYQEVERAVEVSTTLTLPAASPYSLILHPHLGLDGIPGGRASRGGKYHLHPPYSLILHPHLGLDGIPGGRASRGGKYHLHPPCSLILHPHLGLDGIPRGGFHMELSLTSLPEPSPSPCTATRK